MRYASLSTNLFSSLPYSFFLNHPPTPEIYTLSLHDALPISFYRYRHYHAPSDTPEKLAYPELTRVTSGLFGIGELLGRSEEHTSELQSHSDLVCRLLLEKKKKKRKQCIAECSGVKA